MCWRLLLLLLLLRGFLPVFCEDAVISEEETLDGVGAGDLDILVTAPDTGNQESGESEDDDHDLNTGDNRDGPDDEDVNDGEAADENWNDEEPADDDLNDEEHGDEDLNDEEPTDEDVYDEDAKDSDEEQVLTTTPSPEIEQTVTVPWLQQTAIKSTGVASNKKGHVTVKKGHVTIKKGNRPERVGESQRVKPANSKVKKAPLKSAKINDSNQTSNDANSKNLREGALRKKRLPPSSASPSVQLIIVVVGAVLACVLITGFIRWRVRKRLRDKKLGKMDNLYRSRMALPKTSIMDTIYECECEDRLTALRAQNTDEAHDGDDPLGGAKTKEEELYCSHRFDQPPSMASSRHFDDDSYRSLKGTTEFDVAYGSKKHSRWHKKHHHHHSHKSRYSRHHRRKSHHKHSSHKAERVSPISDECAEENLDDIDCSTSLLEATETTEVKTTATDTEPGPATLIPVELQQSNPHQTWGSVLGPVLTTWQSLSFNRDWVGRMWQEKHKVRRISDVLRNMTLSINLGSEESPADSQTSDEDLQNQSPSDSQTSDEDLQNPSSSDSQTSDEDVQNKSAEATLAMEHSMTETHSNNQDSGETVCSADADNSTDSTVITLFNSDDVAENSAEQSGLSGETVGDTLPNGTTCVEGSSSQPQGGSVLAFLSFSDYNEGPPHYESLLERLSYSNHSTPPANIEHHRHHRRHHRKGRERSNRHVHSRVQGVDSSHTDTRDPHILHSHEEHTPLISEYKTHEIPSNPRLESQSGEASTVTTPLCSSDPSEDPNSSHQSFTNSTSGHSVSPAAAPFVPQEGIVLEQLSDGSQIIYLPPPVLPRYYNDTPPPYHK